MQSRVCQIRANAIERYVILNKKTAHTTEVKCAFLSYQIANNRIWYFMVNKQTITHTNTYTLSSRQTNKKWKSQRWWRIKRKTARNKFERHKQKVLFILHFYAHCTQCVVPIFKVVVLVLFSPDCCTRSTNTSLSLPLFSCVCVQTVTYCCICCSFKLIEITNEAERASLKYSVICFKIL